jgi:hypothetical protein
VGGDDDHVGSKRPDCVVDRLQGARIPGRSPGRDPCWSAASDGDGQPVPQS